MELIITLARAQAIIGRIFDRKLEGGLGFNFFIILYYLSSAQGERMRRTDLAQKVGLTASGVTRSLLPMEKIGLVTREASDHDGRVTYVKMAQGGKRLLSEAMETAERLSEELIDTKDVQRLDEMIKLFSFESYTE